MPDDFREGEVGETPHGLRRDIAAMASVYRRCALLPDMDVMNCGDLAVPVAVMRHVVDVESSFNPYAIGVVGGRLLRQPAGLQEAIATARMLESRGFNFSLGLAQVNRHNLAKYGLSSYAKAFEACPNLRAGSRILADCRVRSGNDWGRSLSCYYSGNFADGFRDGYVQKVFASMRAAGIATGAEPPRAIPLISATTNRTAAQRSSLTPAVGPRISQPPTGPTPTQPASPVVNPTAADTAPLAGDAMNKPTNEVVERAAAMAAAGPALGTVDAAFVF
jgi:type IV secretion system protein VirB1